MDANPKQRRRHSAQFKAEVIAACAEPGASVAAVARRFELNDNLVHQWRRGRGVPSDPIATPRFIALPLSSAPEPAPAPGPQEPQGIRIEVRRGAMSINVTWPSGAATECAAWMRELLR